MPTLDAAKFLAAIGVIWIHVCQSPNTFSLGSLGRFAVPFFAATAGYLLVLSQQRKSDQSFGDFVSSRFSRLYIPFLAWSGIYLIFKWTKKVAFGHDETVLPGWDIFISGGAYHLWFIPYLIIASSAAFFAIRRIAHSPKQQLNSAVICYLAGIILALWLTLETSGDTSTSFMLMATPGLLWGLALGWLQAAQKAKTGRAGLTTCSPTFTASLTAVFLLATTMTITAGRNVLLENASGVALLLSAIYLGHLLPVDAFQTRTGSLISRLGEVSFGIYFSHLVFIKVGEVILNRLGATDTVWVAIAMACIVTTTATICCIIAARHKLTRWLVA